MALSVCSVKQRSASAFRRAVTVLSFLVVLGGAASAHAAVTKKIAVLMFLPQNYGSEWVDEETVREEVWTLPDSANEYYLEESFGKWKLGGALRADGDIFGWFTVPYDDTGDCVPYPWISYAKTMAAAQGYVESNYDALIYVTKATGCPGRAWTMGKVITVINGFNAPTVLHELGHAFGLAHASTWICKNALGVKVPISSSCTVSEYGDFAAMGQTTSYHMNNYQKGVLGWLAASNTKDVTSDGLYSLRPIEWATTAVQVLRVPRKYDLFGKISDYYYLELRQPFGFDDFSLTNAKATGISIRVAPSYSVIKAHTYLLDTSTPALTGFGDAQLKVGAVFNDPTRRVNITLVSIIGGVAQVLIDFY
jgi:hypothetical protein